MIKEVPAIKLYGADTDSDSTFMVREVLKILDDFYRLSKPSRLEVIESGNRPQDQG
jgi:hypothetical protein